MRLGPKTRGLLELMAALGLETIDAVLTLPVLYKSLHFSNERNFYDTAKRLQSNGLIQLDKPSNKTHWVGKLTEQGKSVLNSKIDPTVLWKERWDGKWRLISFDLPSEAWVERQALRKWLKQHRFGCLQGSVWISPRNLGNWSSELANLEVEPNSVTFITGEFGGDRKPSDYVLQAWDFEQINRNYRAHLEFLSRNTAGAKSNSPFEDWFANETRLWRKSFSIDPFLSQDLLPSEPKFKYLGPTALEKRKEAYETWRQFLFP